MPCGREVKEALLSLDNNDYSVEDGYTYIMTPASMTPGTWKKRGWKDSKSPNPRKWAIKIIWKGKPSQFLYQGKIYRGRGRISRSQNEPIKKTGQP